MKTYYIQNGWVGNAVAWWKKGGGGYGTDIRDAEIFTEQDAMKLIKERDDFKAWECQHVDALESPARKIIIDSQYLESKFRLKL